MTDATRRSRCRRPPYATATFFALAAALATTTLAAGPATATLRGKIVGWEKLLPQVYVDASKNDSRRYTWREPSPTVKQEFRRLSASPSRDVCIVALATGAAAQPHEPMAIKVTGGRMTPSTLVLSPGSRVSFKNVDPFPHILYEVGNDKWAANSVAPGSAREWAATGPGLHVIRDEQFTSIVMYVVVDPAATEFAAPDHEGGFSMAVPPGDYTLKAFFDGKQVGKEAAAHVGTAGFEVKDPMAVGSGDSK
jgi:plastocyanin